MNVLLKKIKTAVSGLKTLRRNDFVLCYLWEESKEKPKKSLFFFLWKFELGFEFYDSNQFSLINLSQ